MKTRNRLWKASKFKKNTISRCSEITVYDSSGNVKEVVQSIYAPKQKKVKDREQLDALDNERRSPEYDQWREKVRKRDHSTCALCGSKEWIQVHHISRWIDDEEQRYNANNGVCLCIVCHQKGHGPHNEPFPNHLTIKLINYVNGVNGL